MIVPACKANEVWKAELYVADNGPDAQDTISTSVSVCDCNSYWFRVRWKAGESSSSPPDARDNPFDVEIWEPGATHGDGTKIWSKYNIADVDPGWQQEVDDITSTPGTHEIHAYVHRVGTDMWKRTNKCTVKVVEVDKIEIYAGDPATWHDVTGISPRVLKGMKYDFRAIPNPSDVAWPSGAPKWYWNGGEIATGSTVNVTFDSDGTHTLAVKCRDCVPGKAVTIKVVTPWVEDIDFSGTTNYTMKDDSSPPDSIDTEYDKSAAVNEPACQQMGERVTLNSVKFRASDDLSFPTSVKVIGFDFAVLTFPEVSDTWSSWDSSGISMTSTNDEYGRLPDYVSKIDDVQLVWMYRVPLGTNAEYFCAAKNPTEHVVYTVLGSPVDPQAEPWQDVLDIACVEASGSSTTTDAMWDIWNDFYNDAGGVYDTNVGGCHYCVDGGNGTFHLTSWLTEYDTVSTVNCADMGKALVVFGNALGCGGEYYTSSSFGYLNCINPVGTAWTNNPFYNGGGWIDSNAIVDGDWDSSDGRSGFLGYHAFASVSYYIYDASGGEVDLGTSPWDPNDSTDGDRPDYGPPFNAHELDGDDTWSSSYKDRVVDDVPSSPTQTPVPHIFGVD